MLAVQVLDRCDAGPAEAPVDARHEPLDLVALRLVLGALEPRRHEHLQQRRRSRALGVSLEKALECAQLLRDPLRVVETLHAQQERPVAKPVLQLLELARGGGITDRLAKGDRVDPDRVDADPDRPAVDLDRVRRRVEAQHTQAGRPEVTGVVGDSGTRHSPHPEALGAPIRATAAADTPRWKGTGCAGRSRSRDRVVPRGASRARA